MKKLFRLHLQQLQLSICYYSHFLAKNPRHLWSGSCSLVFIFLLAQGLLLFRLVIQLKHQFAEIYPQINKKIRFYYLGVLTIDFLFLSF